MDPTSTPFPASRSSYRVRYGRAPAQLRGRQDDAVRALRTAEELNPTLVHRHLMVREVLAELLSRVRRDAVGRELHGMAYRAGLPGSTDPSCSPFSNTDCYLDIMVCTFPRSAPPPACVGATCQAGEVARPLPPYVKGGRTDPRSERGETDGQARCAEAAT